ncbi:MAG: M20/M25/M40 family metallo-hydrolase [Lachnospiraceae bacterium]|nr:M20/M25/M40 family metallo-hydrolase [Lachnospiraceae bacterium]
MMENELRSYIEANREEMYGLLKDLCLIPAPSHLEHKRAEYCKNWLEKAGAEGVYIDEALNVIFPINCENSDKLTVFVAHTDTVFPDTEPMPYLDDGERIHCPGVGDDTASLTVMMLTAKYFVEKKIVPADGLMFVCNSCEEGLGNLKGTRQLFKDFEGRIARFISLDSSLNAVADNCAGSHRYEVEVLTEGGHSYGKFGNANAIAELSKMVAAIYAIEVPKKEGCRTTYNVGTISGGTSVNTIAQNAKMLCEYRSSDRECLAIMQEKFEAIFEQAKSEKVQVKIDKVGDRPCSNIDDAKIDELRKIVRPIIEEVTGAPVTFKSSSTDCNIPLSLGIPALCVGVYRGNGAHTRQEWVEKASLIPGLEIAIRLATIFAEG